jgi:superfamily II DNA/RNA helicase
LYSLSGHFVFPGRLVNFSASNIGGQTGLEWAHPLVQEWFVGRFGTPTEPQKQGWPHILEQKDTLICAPTGSGKTLAAFLACIDGLVCKALSGELEDKTEVLYVSPLKALGNDIQGIWPRRSAKYSNSPADTDC